MRKAAIAALLMASLGAAGCETYNDHGYSHHGRYGAYDYSGGDYDRLGNDCDYFSGSGGEWLDPWLACTAEGQDLVRRMFDKGANRRVSRKTADRANVWFRRHADHNRDLRLTDPEIRAALVNHARHSGMQVRGH